MKHVGIRLLSGLVISLLLFALLPWAALAEDGDQVFYSSTVAIEDLATLAQVLEEETGETPEGEVPQGGTRVSIQWLPDDTNAPFSAVIIIVGSGAPEKVVLEREKGWQTTVKLADSTVPRSYTLLQQSDYYVTSGEDSVLFTVTLPTPEPTDPEPEPELEIEEEDPVAGPDAQRSVGISANVSAEQGVSFGDTIVLTGVLVGYEDAAYTLAWQCDKGSGWEMIPGADGLAYSYVLDEENVAWSFRLEVALLQE